MKRIRNSAIDPLHRLIEISNKMTWFSGILSDFDFFYVYWYAFFPSCKIMPKNLTFSQSIRNALVWMSFPGKLSFYLRNVAGTRSFFQRQEQGRNALLIYDIKVPRSSFLFLTYFDIENFKKIYYLKIRCVKANSTILKWLKLVTL